MIFPICQYSGHAKPGNRRYCRLKMPASLVTLQRCLNCPHASNDIRALIPVCDPPQTSRELPCALRGKVIRTVGCKVCGGKQNNVPVYSCAKYGECTPVRQSQLSSTKVCLTCPDRIVPDVPQLPPLTGPANLMWFVYPRRQTRDVWLAQQEIIREALPQFDGKKLLAIATDDSTDAAAIEQTGWDEVVELPNDRTQREVLGWRWGIGRAKELPGFTVWLHAKGAVRGCAEPHLEAWWKLGYEALLDVAAVRASLESSLITGVFRRNQPAVNLGVPWHFSGSFYAVRNEAITFPASKAGGWYAEAWPALVAPRELSACLKFDGCRDLYLARNWRGAA